MKRKMVVALSIFLVVAVVANVVGFMWFQSSLVNENNYLKAENSVLQDLADERSHLYYENQDLESQNDQLVEQLGDLTEELALARPLRVEIVSFSQ